MSDKSCKEEYIRRIHKVQDYMEQHFSENLSLEELSNAAGFSKFHFSRIFQSIVHESLAHYVNRIHMEGALFMLAHRMDKNMTDIAYELGFTDSAVFSRAFKNFYGISPREYRQEYSKNCKDSFLLSEYNKTTAMNEWSKDHLPVTGNITIEHMSELQLAYVRHTGTYETLATEYPKLLQVLFEHAAKQKLLVGDQNLVLAIYHDNPEFGDENQFRTSLCISVPDHMTIQEDGILSSMRLDGGMYAVGHFSLTPDQFSGAWDYMYQEWLTGSGYMPRNSYPFESYRNDPNENPEHISEVDIYVPIEPIRF